MGTVEAGGDGAATDAANLAGSEARADLLGCARVGAAFLLVFFPFSGVGSAESEAEGVESTGREEFAGSSSVGVASSGGRERSGVAECGMAVEVEAVGTARGEGSVSIRVDCDAPVKTGAGGREMAAERSDVD